MKVRISALAAIAWLLGTTAALAQVSGAAPNGTTPGAIGNGPNQSLQEPSSGTGLGYSPTAPSLGVSPDATGATTYDPNAPLPPMPNQSSGSPGSSASGSVAGPASPSGG